MYDEISQLNIKTIMYLKRILILVLIFALGGCATVGVLPSAVDIDKSRTYNAPFDQVWSAIIAGVAESNLSITTIERDSGIIAISNVIYEQNWADEGTRGSVAGEPNLITERIANFNIFASKQGLELTSVQVNSIFKMQIRSGNGSQMFPYQYQWHQVYSNGTLETLILDGIVRRLK